MSAIFILNGEPQPVPAPATIAGLIATLKLEGQRVAIELNGEIVPRSGWAAVALNADDRIELVKAIGGG